MNHKSNLISARGNHFSVILPEIVYEYMNMPFVSGKSGLSILGTGQVEEFADESIIFSEKLTWRMKKGFGQLHDFGGESAMG